MRADFLTPAGSRITAEAVAGSLVLQLVRPMGAAGVAAITVALTTEQAAQLLDVLAGVACIAEEQAFELDTLAALAAAGMPPRDFSAGEPAEAPADIPIPAFLRGVRQ